MDSLGERVAQVADDGAEDDLGVDQPGQAERGAAEGGFRHGRGAGPGA